MFSTPITRRTQLAQLSGGMFLIFSFSTKIVKLLNLEEVLFFQTRDFS